MRTYNFYGTLIVPKILLDEKFNEIIKDKSQLKPLLFNLSNFDINEILKLNDYDSFYIKYKPLLFLKKLLRDVLDESELNFSEENLDELIYFLLIIKYFNEKNTYEKFYFFSSEYKIWASNYRDVIGTSEELGIMFVSDDHNYQSEHLSKFLDFEPFEHFFCYLADFSSIEIDTDNIIGIYNHNLDYNFLDYDLRIEPLVKEYNSKDHLKVKQKFKNYDFLSVLNWDLEYPETKKVNRETINKLMFEWVNYKYN